MRKGKRDEHTISCCSFLPSTPVGFLQKSTNKQNQNQKQKLKKSACSAKDTVWTAAAAASSRKQRVTLLDGKQKLSDCHLRRREKMALSWPAHSTLPCFAPFSDSTTANFRQNPSQRLSASPNRRLSLSGTVTERRAAILSTTAHTHTHNCCPLFA